MGVGASSGCLCIHCARTAPRHSKYSEHLCYDFSALSQTGSLQSPPWTCVVPRSMAVMDRDSQATSSSNLSAATIPLWPQRTLGQPCLEATQTESFEQWILSSTDTQVCQAPEDVVAHVVCVPGLSALTVCSMCMP